MKDLVDTINQRNKMKNSVIKGWNVNYVDIGALRRMEEERKKAEAQAVLSRLAFEKESDDAVKNAQIELAYQQAQQAEFNATTGSYSGGYGRGSVDEVNRDQINMILHEKDDYLRTLINREKR